MNFYELVLTYRILFRMSRFIFKKYFIFYINKVKLYDKNSHLFLRGT